MMGLRVTLQILSAGSHSRDRQVAGKVRVTFPFKLQPNFVEKVNLEEIAYLINAARANTLGSASSPFIDGRNLDTTDFEFQIAGLPAISADATSVISGNAQLKDSGAGRSTVLLHLVSKPGRTKHLFVHSWLEEDEPPAYTTPPNKVKHAVNQINRRFKRGGYRTMLRDHLGKIATEVCINKMNQTLRAPFKPIWRTPGLRVIVPTTAAC